MGRRGPAPLPTKLKLVHGEARASRLNLTEPEPADEAPTVPADLDPEARIVWDRVLRTQAPGVILAAHTDTLRLYAEAVVRYEEAAALLRGSGPLLIDRHHGGAAVRNPLHQIVRDNATLVRQLAGDLGLNPSALSGVHVTAKPQGSQMARILARRQTG